MDQPIEIEGRLVCVANNDEVHAVGTSMRRDFAAGKDDNSMPLTSGLGGIDPIASVVICQRDYIDARSAHGEHVCVKKSVFVLFAVEAVVRASGSRKFQAGVATCRSHFHHLVPGMRHCKERHVATSLRDGRFKRSQQRADDRVGPA